MRARIPSLRLGPVLGPSESFIRLPFGQRRFLKATREQGPINTELCKIGVVAQEPYHGPYPFLRQKACDPNM